MKIAIVGTVGVPGCYGGFETLAENLVRFHHKERRPEELTVYCSRTAYPDMPPRYLSARLRYSRLNANGIQSILYDALALAHAALRRTDAILPLGVSGAAALPLIRLCSRSRIITNIDGIEWKRAKWTGFARAFLRWSEGLAVRFSHEVVADNQAIADHVLEAYGIRAKLIEYGGDHAIEAAAAEHAVDGVTLPQGYALALCRIEPENNVEMILEAFAQSGRPLVFVGNWDKGDFGRGLRERFAAFGNIVTLDPIYDEGRLRRIRSDASAYIHGHSAGGTNPALVEMMHFGLPVLAFDCVFNRYTTEGAAMYFTSAEDLARQIGTGSETAFTASGARLLAIASERYTWDRICRIYFDLATAPGRSRKDAPPTVGTTASRADGISSARRS